MNIILCVIVTQRRDTKIDIIINVGHSDLYFTVHEFASSTYLEVFIMDECQTFG